MSLDNKQPQRRRGEALEHALLAAAWAELTEKGYDAFTIDAVAARAETSRAVIYRRWPDKPSLVTAAIMHSGFSTRIEVPDTGSLRTDVIELLRSANRTRAHVAILLTARLGTYLAESGKSFAEIRERIRAGRADALTVILDRAVARGEADPARLTPRVRTVAFDLYRSELLMTNQPVADEVIEAIVDEVLLPLVR
ncbi:MAG: TetR/AcrR family transcriptional regulator [Nocardioides sp.]|nr:TetR/AcrR family transcriptional regulator [Nocardioides sp.]